jgi:chromatin-remodeling ATPase INO80
MAFSSILSSSTTEPQPTQSETPSKPLPRKTSRASDLQHSPIEQATISSSRRTSNRNITPTQSNQQARSNGDSDMAGINGHKVNGTKARASISDKENELSAAMALIDDMEMSDLEAPEFEGAMLQYRENRKKRALELDGLEVDFRKVSVLALHPKIFSY